MSKPMYTFHEMRREKGIRSRAIADRANVPLRLEYLYEIGVPTDAETKDKIIAAFCQLTGESYCVSDFEPEEASLEQPTLLLQHLPRSPKPVFFPSNQRGQERKRAHDS